MRKYLSILSLCFGAAVPALVVAGALHTGTRAVEFVPAAAGLVKLQEQTELPRVYARTIVINADSLKGDKPICSVELDRYSLGESEARDGDRVHFRHTDRRSQEGHHRDRRGYDHVMATDAFARAWVQSETI